MGWGRGLGNPGLLRGRTGANSDSGQETPSWQSQGNSAAGEAKQGTGWEDYNLCLMGWRYLVPSKCRSWRISSKPGGTVHPQFYFTLLGL